MDQADRLRLQRNWTHLMDSVNCDDVIPYLVQDLVLDIDMVEEIEAADTRKRRTRLLLTKLMRRGPSAYQAFRRALLENDVYNHLIERLDSTQIDDSLLSTQENRTDKTDLGITPMDDDAPSSLSSRTPMSASQVVTGSHDSPAGQVLPQPTQSLPSNSSSNFRIAGNNNFVIVGSNNTQVYYH